MPKKVTGILRRKLYKMLQRKTMMDKDISKKLKISINTIATYKRKWNFFKTKRENKLTKNKNRIRKPKNNHIRRTKVNHAGRPKQKRIIKLDKKVKQIIIELC